MRHEADAATRIEQSHHRLQERLLAGQWILGKGVQAVGQPQQLAEAPQVEAATS
jgi:hypothetical protein